MNRMSFPCMIAMVVVISAILFPGMADAGKMCHEEKIQIWKYYTRFEDIYGTGKAEILTVRKFAVSGVELESIIAEGRMEKWPLPGQERESDCYATSSEERGDSRLEAELRGFADGTGNDSSNMMAGRLNIKIGEP